MMRVKRLPKTHSGCQLNVCQRHMVSVGLRHVPSSKRRPKTRGDCEMQEFFFLLETDTVRADGSFAIGTSKKVIQLKNKEEEEEEEINTYGNLNYWTAKAKRADQSRRNQRYEDQLPASGPCQPDAFDGASDGL